MNSKGILTFKWTARALGSLFVIVAAIIGVFVLIRDHHGILNPFAATYLTIAALGGILLGISWKWQITGGILYFLLAVPIFIIITILEAFDRIGMDFSYLPSFLWSLPPAVTGVMFLISGVMERRVKMHKKRTEADLMTTQKED